MSPLPRLLARSAALVLSVFAGTSCTFAADVTTTLNVTRGHLTADVAEPRLSLDGWQPFQQRWRRATTRVPVVVSDLRGSGAGWSLALRGAVVTANGRQIGRARATVARIAMRCAGPCTRPRGVARPPLALASSVTTRALAAARGSGMGIVRIGVDVDVVVPRQRYGPLFLVAEVSRVVGP
jgi:hypothetical protein